MRRLLPVLLFVMTYLTAAIVLAVMYWNYEFIYYGVVMFGLIGFVALVDTRVKFSRAVLWGLALWGLAHMVGGTCPIPQSVTEPGTPRVLYNLRLHPNLPKYDQVVHAYGFFVASLASWQALAGAVRLRTGSGLEPTKGLRVAVALMGMGLGAMNEVIEFIATRVMPGTNVGGYDNTGWDLVSNMTGCIAAALIVRARPPEAGAA